MYYFLTFKQTTMNSLLYIIAVILIIGWALGVFMYSATGLIHVLLVIAVISLILGFIRRPTIV
ncbi:hypothetical protein BDD43_1961 [Mucilaginibacter gracilis]|uniref:Lmo0937 family membrane protein n=2 Tax=Mucilaginibacter gracilis TaxID=423350 RepID=A0A495IYM2_9SPHI|nr:hypothetical protein BDD43_1961 [Mucilaginibacter gracilis]